MFNRVRFDDGLSIERVQRRRWMRRGPHDDNDKLERRLQSVHSLRLLTVCVDNQGTGLCINNITLSNVKEFKDLGVVIDDSLKFTSHVNHVVAKASAQACLIHKCFASRDVHTLTRAYKTYVRPLLEYASCVCLLYTPPLLG